MVRNKAAGTRQHARPHGAVVLAAVGVFVAMVFAGPHAGAAFKYLKTGMEVPEFSLKTADGKEHGVAELKSGPASLLVFWATWSPRSEPALRDAQKLYAQYADKGLKVLGINVNRLNIGLEDRQQIDQMREKLGLTFPLVIDQGLETYNSFGVVATPSTAVLNSEAKIVHEAASYLSSTGGDIREAVEILLGVREAPKAEAVAAKPVYKPDSKALRHYNFGRTMLQRGNKDKAIDQLEQSAASDAKYAAPRILLGHLLLGKKDEATLKRAAELFKTAGELDPESVSARTGYGEALLELGQVDEASAQFEKAVAMDPTYTPAVSNLALTLAKKGKADDAQKRFKEALDLNPVDPGTYFRRGQGAEGSGNMKGAAADYRRAVEILMNLPSTGDEV